MNEKSYWVYIICDKPYGTLYIGVTSDLPRRIYEHREGMFEGFSKKYDLKILVYAEEYNYVYDALEREKKLKKWKRQWKIDLIKKDNLQWRDLYENLI